MRRSAAVGRGGPASPKTLGLSGVLSHFLEISPTEHIAGNRLAFAVWDRSPVSVGHALVVARRAIPDWWAATPQERVDLFALVDVVKADIERLHQPEGFTVGFDAGVAAGQAVPHLHLHVIPHYRPNGPRPVGGLRNVIGSISGERISKPASMNLFDGRHATLLTELTARMRDERFDRLDFIVSFVMSSGLDLVEEVLEDAIARGARVRVLTTDYLGITQRSALARFLDRSQDSFGALRVRVFHDVGTSFHPKGYLFWSSQGDVAAAVVGSSNLSRPGLVGGIEWNVGLETVVPMLERFTELWDDPRSVELTADWLRNYHPPVVDTSLAPVIELEEAPVQPVEPRPIQREALAALEQTRIAGHRAGLVVMATGLGKTWLAAFDTARPQFRRVLFVAHREEILRQSRDVFRRVQPDGDFGLYYGEERRPEARVVFASVQTLARRLDAFAPDAFDYIVVDEFHHASASSYRKVLDHFTPAFLLGLTATPDRMDGADLLA